jgi:hypothetical protein
MIVFIKNKKNLFLQHYFLEDGNVKGSHFHPFTRMLQKIVVMFIKKISTYAFKHIRVKAHYGGAQNCGHIVLFLKVPCLNFNHVIIMKDFHNVFAYYGKSKHK